MTLRYSAVLSNPDFELGNMNGWTTLYGTPSVNSDAANQQYGNYYARISDTGTYGCFYQDYLIPSSARVHEGNVSFRMMAAITDFTPDTDRGHMFCHFVTSDGLLCAAWVDSSRADRDQTWETRTSDLIPIPNNAAKIRIGASGQKNTGTELSVYLDQFSLDFFVHSWYTWDISPKNGDFTKGTSYWTVGTGTFAVSSAQGSIQNDRPSGYVNEAYFSSTAIGHIYQRVLIPHSAGLYQNHIDVGSAQFVYRYAQRLYDGEDNALVGVRFLDASDTVLASYSLVDSPFTAARQSIVYVGSTTIPASTRKIQYDYWGVRSGGANLDGYVSLINGHILTNTGLGASSYATTFKSHLNSDTTQATSVFYTLPHSVGMGTDQFRFMYAFGDAANYNSFTSDVPITHGYATNSGGVLENVFYGHHSNNGGAGDWKSIISRSGCLGCWDATGETMYYHSVQSVASGFTYFSDRYASAGLEYVKQFWSGSFEVKVGLVNVDTSSAAFTVVSVGFQPDLVWIEGSNYTQLEDTAVDNDGSAIGYFDLRSFANPQNTNVGYSHRQVLATSYQTIRNVNTTGIGMVYTPGGGENWEMRFAPTSVYNAGFYLECLERPTGVPAVTSPMYMYAAFKFLDGHTNFRHFFYSFVGTSTVQSIQINSIYPYLIRVFATDQQTLDYNTAANQNVQGNAYSEGFHQDGYSTFTINESQRQSTSGMQAYTIVQVSNILNTVYYAPGINDHIYVTSPAPFSGGYSMKGNANVLSNDTEKLGIFVIGPAIHAPNHIQGKDGQSLVLHNKQYPDDLLLVDSPTTEADSTVAASVGVNYAFVRREFWTDINRVFPTQINTIRDFPNV